VESLKARDHFEGVGLDTKIILKMILKDYNTMSESNLNNVLESWVL
jgi:hypothetical protein